MITQKKFDRLIKIFEGYLNNNTERFPRFPKDVSAGFMEGNIWQLWKNYVNKNDTEVTMTIRKRELPNFIKECYNSHLIGKR